MAFIERLQIRGIRSFSPDKDELIEFYSPLTIIVGSNGCGKTTIIEALKYSCCGALPPGTKSGQAFINDPSITETPEVKAHIKLKFTNRRGYQCVATRLLQLSRKRSKLEFKALDSVLKSMTENGEVSTSMKCSELDKQIPDLVGVSAAVMESVIFCHQEESDWPMQDGAMVKKKFDDIFDSTRYSKALEAIMKAKKEKVMTAKDLKAEVSELGAHLLSVNQLNKDYQTCVENQTSCTDQLALIEEALERYNERIQSCRAFLAKYQKITDEINNLQIRISETEKRVQEKTLSLDSVLTVSDHELKHLIQNFEIEMEGKQIEKVEIQRLIDSANDDIKSIRIKLEDLGREEGKAIAAKNQLKEMKDSSFSLMNSAAVRHSIPQLKSQPWTPILTQEFIKTLLNKNDRLVADADDGIKRIRRIVEENERKLMEERGQQRAKELQVQSIHKELNRISEERDAKRRELSSLGFSKTDYQVLQSSVDESKSKCTTFEVNMGSRIGDLKKEQKDTSDKIRELEIELESHDQILQNLVLYRNEKAMIQAEDRRVQEDYESISNDILSFSQSYQYREILMPFADLFSSAQAGGDRIFTSLDINVVSNQLKSSGVTISREYNELNNRVMQLQQEKSKYEGLLSQEQASLKTFRIREIPMKAKEEKYSLLIRRANGLFETYRYSFFTSDESNVALSDDLAVTSTHDILERIQSMTSDVRDYILLVNAEKILKSKFQKKRKELGSDRCPCCLQSMSSEVALTYDASIQELLVPSAGPSGSSVPINEEDAKRVESQCQDIYSELLTITSDLTELTLIRNDITSCEKKIYEFATILETHNTELQRFQSVLPLHLARKQSFESCIKDLSVIHQNLEMFEKRKAEGDAKKLRASQTAALSIAGTYSSSSSGLDDQFRNKSVEEFESYSRERRNKKDELVKHKEKLRNDEDGLTKTYQSLKDILSLREKDLNNMKIKADRYNDLEQMVKSLNQQYEDQDLQLRLFSSAPSGGSYSASSYLGNDTVTELEGHVLTAKSELKDLEEQKQKKCILIQNDISQIQSILDNIIAAERKFSAEYEQLSIESLAVQRSDLSSAITQHEDRIRSQYQPKLQLIHNAISSQERFKRNVNDNLVLRQSQAELEVLKREVDKLEFELSSGQGVIGQTNVAARFKDTQREVQRIDQEKSRYQSEKDMLRGKYDTYHEQLLNIESKLKSTVYKGVEDRHRRKVIEFETTEMAVKDLDSYYSALDNALQNFHTQKIKEINKIIRELWQLVYKGQDIDMIEVESGQETSTGLAVTARSGSRSYNYRVVMRKGDVPLDMRGRCSAGQRILASIVIRLALAETFCLNCGILALDEPTTNLDDANKEGLAYCLARIIQSRAKQQNFQLICITHDMDFVRMMNTELSGSADFRKPDYYFRVYRTEEGSTGKFFSHIQRTSWEEM